MVGRYQAMTTRAFEIADTSMLAQLECHALRASGHPENPMFSLVDVDGNEVAHLADSDPAIIEAVEWLQARGLVKVIESEHGEAIMLSAEAQEN